MNRILISEVINKKNEIVSLTGWVHSRRDHGKIIFIDLRDRSGLIQIVFLPQNKEVYPAPFRHSMPSASKIKKVPERCGVYQLANTLRPEWVISLEGKVQERPKGMENPKIPTGKIEVTAEKLNILNQAKTPPFEISEEKEINEEVRLKYRYLDLRRERMKNNIILRHKVIKFIRDFMNDKGFLEIETPILTKATPEGARDYIVPSRIYPGQFYALPQSPQQYKQLLMVAGIEKYFQIARCFRDEDTRGDRQPEFTQLDVEMSFVKQEDILNLIEELFTNLVKALCPEKKITQCPWPRLSHNQAQKEFDSDKPDLRKNKNNPNELAFAWIIDFPLFAKQTKEDFYHGSGSAKFAPSHHMFTAPHPDDIALLDSDPLKVRGLQYDLVLNGYEVGGGSIRIHQPEIQEKIFDLIGFTKEQKKQFEHLLTAFTYGVPPHGGIAPGIDRFVMILAGEPNIREIIAFPKTGDGRDLMMEAPSEVSPTQLKELHIKVVK